MGSEPAGRSETTRPGNHRTGRPEPGAPCAPAAGSAGAVPPSGHGSGPSTPGTPKGTPRGQRHFLGGMAAHPPPATLPLKLSHGARSPLPQQRVPGRTAIWGRTAFWGARPKLPWAPLPPHVPHPHCVGKENARSSLDPALQTPLQMPSFLPPAPPTTRHCS